MNWILAPQLPFISYKHEYVLEWIEIERLKMDNINYWANGGHQVWLLKKDIYNLERRTATEVKAEIAWTTTPPIATTWFDIKLTFRIQYTVILTIYVLCINQRNISLQFLSLDNKVFLILSYGNINIIYKKLLR